MKGQFFFLLSAAFLLLCGAHPALEARVDGKENSLQHGPVDEDGHQVALLKRSLRSAFEEQLALLQDSEAKIVEQIEALKRRRSEISQKKRSHFMCLVNLVTCYKKRK